MTQDLTLYEVALSDGRSASPFVWRIKLSLARKGIAYRSQMLGLTDIPKQFGGRFHTLPVIDFGDRQMNESITIADWLDEAFPDRPRIFFCPAERAMIAFFDHWLVHDVIISHLLPIYMLDAHDWAAPHDRDYYRRTREAHFGVSLEEIVANREARLPGLRQALGPVRRTIANQPFLGGAEPNFADMCMLGLFIFVGAIATMAPLSADDPLVAYAARGLEAFSSETASLNLKLCA